MSRQQPLPRDSHHLNSYYNNMNHEMRAVGFVNYDASAGGTSSPNLIAGLSAGIGGSRGNFRRPCVVFLQQTDTPSFGKPAAQLVLQCIAASNVPAIPFCTVPPHVTQHHHVQQVHVSMSGEYVSFIVSESSNPDSKPKPPMLFHRVSAPGVEKKVSQQQNSSASATAATATSKTTTTTTTNQQQQPSSISSSNNSDSLNLSSLTGGGMELRACDDYINHESDLSGDQLQALYFPQFSPQIGESGTTWVFAQCKAQTGTRNMYLVKIQPPGTSSFFNFSFFSRRSRKLAAASLRHIPGTDLLLACSHKMAPTQNVPVRHFSIHAVTSGASFDKLYEVQLPRELSVSHSNESLLGAYVFYDSSVTDEVRFLRESSAGSNSSASSFTSSSFSSGGGGGGGGGGFFSGSSSSNSNSSGNFYASTPGRRLCTVIVAYVLFDHPVKSEAAGIMNPTQEIIYRNVVRLFVFRPRSVYSGQDWYIDLYFSKRNIAAFQLSSLGQMVVMSPGYKAYFVDVKFFPHNFGPSVSFVQNLDYRPSSSSSLKHSQNKPHHRSSTAISSSTSNQNTANSTSSSSSLDKQKKILTTTATTTKPQTQYQDPAASTSATQGEVNNNNTNTNNNANESSSSGQPVPTFCPSLSEEDMMNAATATAISSIKSNDSETTTGNNTNDSSNKSQEHETSLPPPLVEEGCFLGENLPDCFLRTNCVPPRLPPLEVASETGRYIIFFSTHTPAVLFLENRFPVWQAVQQGLLHDRLRRISNSNDRNHDGEANAKGMLMVMDRVAMSLVVSRASCSPASTYNFFSLSPVQSGNKRSPVPTTSTSSATSGTATGLSCSPIDRATSSLNEDNKCAFRSLIPVFQAGITRMRDPTSLCMEWIIAAAYFRLGWRQNSPPRLLFDFSAYEGLIHPHSLPRTTNQIKGQSCPMRTALISGSSSNSFSGSGGVDNTSATISSSSGGGGGGFFSSSTSSNSHFSFSNIHNNSNNNSTTNLSGGGGVLGHQGLVYVHPRDEFVRAVENRIDESFSSRDTLIQCFREFSEYEEEILGKLYRNILEVVRTSINPGSSRNARVAAQMASSSQRSNTTNTNKSNNERKNSTNNNNQKEIPTTAEGTTNRKVVAISTDVQFVNELSFFLCRLTALEILGVRIDEKSPVFTTSVVWIASSNNVLPFSALARATWLKTISSQQNLFSTALVPLSRLASKEKQRLKVQTDDARKENNNNDVDQEKINNSDNDTCPIFVTKPVSRRFLPMVDPSTNIYAPFCAGSNNNNNGGGGFGNDNFFSNNSSDAKRFLRSYSN